MTEHTHESDKALWLKAHHMAPSATLPDGVMLTDDERNYAIDAILENEEADNRERFEAKCR